MHKILLFLLLFVNFSASGQSTERTTFSEVHLEKIKEDLRYDKTKRALVPRNPPKERKSEFKEKKVRKPIKAPVPGSLFAYVLGGILLSVILYYLVVALLARKKKSEAK